MQGGPLGVALLQADILSVHPVMPGDAVCSLYAKCRGTYSIKTEPSSGVRTGAFISENNEFRFTDFAHPVSPLFVRRMECFDNVSFGISTPPDARRRLFSHRDDASMLLSSPAGDICITLRGKACFTPDWCIRFGTGKSEMIICSLTGDKRAGFPGVPPEADGIYEEIMENADPRITTVTLRDTVNRICRGGVLHSFAEGTYHTEEQYQAVKALCAARLFVKAKGIINFMLGIYRTHGHLPMIHGERSVYDPFPAIRNSYLALALKEYYDRSGDDRYIKSTLYEVSTALTYILDCVKGGHLPHLGDEGVYGKDLLLPSKKSEALFAEAAEAVEEMSRELKVRTVSLRRAKSSVREDSVSQRRPTRALRTVCEECGRDGVCYLGRYGRYLCPSCYIQ